jgi:single-strand DNA-binding protein
MAGSVNKAIIIGRLGRDPEVRSFSNGGKVCNLSVATSETWKDRNSGERKERTEWHRDTIHAEGLIGIAEQFLRKGSNVYLEGQIETRKYQDQSGQDRYTTEVVLRPYNGTLTLLDGRRDGDGGGSGGDYGGDQGGGSSGNSGSGSGYGSGGRPSGGEDLSDEIPFNMEWRI